MMRRIIAAAVLAMVLVAGCVNQTGPSSESEITVHDNVQVDVIHGDYVLDNLHIDIMNESMNQSDLD